MRRTNRDESGISRLADDELGRFAGKSVLVTGAGGMLGRAFIEALAPLGREVRLRALPRAELDVTDARAVMRCARHRPDFILHCGGMSLADACEREPDLARRVHVDGTVNICRLARETGARVFYPQSVFIFDGGELPVTESTPPSPTLVYGRYKLEAERQLLQSLPDALVVRMAGFFGGDARDKNFVGQFTRKLGSLLAAGRGVCEVGDRSWQPTYTLDHARNTLLLLARGCSGIYHMGAVGEATFVDVARACVEALGLTGRVDILPRPAEQFDRAEPARRPRRMITATLRLDREGLNRQRPWRTALGEYLARPYFDVLRRPARAANG